MAIDLATPDDRLFYLIARLCAEAGVCLHDPGTNPVEVHAAEWDAHYGLRVKDEHGAWWRIRPVAEPLALDRYDRVQERCPKCRRGSYACQPAGGVDEMTCADCGYRWEEPAE